MLEELKRCVHPGQRQYLEEREVHGVRKAAVLLDEYVLSHKGAFKIPQSKTGGQSVSRKGAVAPSTPKPEVKGSDPPEKSPTVHVSTVRRKGI